MYIDGFTHTHTHTRMKTHRNQYVSSKPKYSSSRLHGVTSQDRVDRQSSKLVGSNDYSAVGSIKLPRNLAP